MDEIEEIQGEFPTATEEQATTGGEINTTAINFISTESAFISTQSSFLSTENELLASTDSLMTTAVEAETEKADLTTDADLLTREVYETTKFDELISIDQRKIESKDETAPAQDYKIPLYIWVSRFVKTFNGLGLFILLQNFYCGVAADAPRFDFGLHLRQHNKSHVIDFIRRDAGRRSGSLTFGFLRLILDILSYMFNQRWLFFGIPRSQEKNPDFLIPGIFRKSSGSRRILCV